MGGYLPVRAAAFEHRLAGTIADDEVYDVYAAFRRIFLKAAGQSQDTNETELADGKLPTAAPWSYEQGLWASNAKTGVELLERLKALTLGRIGHLVKGPFQVSCAQADQFFRGQHEMVRDALGDRCQFESLGPEETAKDHCHVGATVLANQRPFDSLERAVGGNDAQVQQAQGVWVDVPHLFR
jgi:hypothetical protein